MEVAEIYAEKPLKNRGVIATLQGRRAKRGDPCPSLTNEKTLVSKFNIPMNRVPGGRHILPQMASTCLSKCRIDID